MSGTPPPCWRTFPALAVQYCSQRPCRVCGVHTQVASVTGCVVHAAMEYRTLPTASKRQSVVAVYVSTASVCALVAAACVGLIMSAAAAPLHIILVKLLACGTGVDVPSLATPRRRTAKVLSTLLLAADTLTNLALFSAFHAVFSAMRCGHTPHTSLHEPAPVCDGGQQRTSDALWLTTLCWLVGMCVVVMRARYVLCDLATATGNADCNPTSWRKLRVPPVEPPALVACSGKALLVGKAAEAKAAVDVRTPVAVSAAQRPVAELLALAASSTANGPLSTVEDMESGAADAQDCDCNPSAPAFALASTVKRSSVPRSTFSAHRMSPHRAWSTLA